jgi:PAS domain S-box-containing protein
VLNDEGNIREWVGTCIDITERKKTEDKIKVFSDAIASGFDCFILTDTKGNITYANESAFRVFGYTPEEFLKLNIADLDADPKVAKKVMQEMLAKGKWSGEVTNIRKNKGKFYSLLSAFIIKDEKGNPKGYMGILRDITERKNIRKNSGLCKK